jgi:hypothetical protein
MKSERKTSFAIPWRRLEDIRMGFKETGLGWINSAPEKNERQHILVFVCLFI